MRIFHRFRDILDDVRLVRRDVALLGIDYFVIKYRSRYQSLKHSKSPRYFGGFAVALLTLLTLAVGIAFLYSQSWSGFGSMQVSSSTSAKTLWDWMELLIIPLALVGIAFLFRMSEVQSANQQTRERSRDEALNSFFEHIQEILIGSKLRDEQAIKHASKLATARTISLLRALDPERKVQVLRFLYDAGLIEGSNPFVSLIRADFSEITDYKSYLLGTNLHGVNLNKSNLQSCCLDEVNLSGASLHKARLSFTQLNGANLEYALLDEADLYHAQLNGVSLIKAQAQRSNFAGAFLDNAALRDVDFTRANLRKVKLRKAHLVRARLMHANLRNADLSGADLTEANLMYADLSGADFTEANLTNAVVSQSQLRRTKSISGATLFGIRDRVGSPQMS